jgi:sterol desaturase/sphingolipid hydroxylase (fatty acid hydroxylase superfamily)
LTRQAAAAAGGGGGSGSSRRGGGEETGAAARRQSRGSKERRRAWEGEMGALEWWPWSEQEWLGNPQLCYGLGPFIAVNVGHWFAVLCLEAVIRLPGVAPAFIEYGAEGKSRRKRWDAVAESRKKISAAEQWRVAALNMLGPMAMVNALVSSIVMPRLIAAPAGLPTWQQALLSFCALNLVGDFFLFAFHKAEHEIPFLWRHHQYHHRIDTPTPVSTVCIDPLDATLQAGIPLGLAALICQPHPFVFYAYGALRLCENVVNHSGLDHWLLNLISLKVLPGRAGVAHHDSHHRFSNYERHAKNFAEGFWIYDYAFGSLKVVGESNKA